jgi:hypothetical protein
MLSAKLFAALAILQLGFALLPARAAQSEQCVFRVNLFRRFPLATASTKQFSWSYALRYGDNCLCPFLRVSVRARLCSDSRGFTTGRGCARGAQFPFGLRHTRREFYMDCHYDSSVPQKATSRVVAIAGCGASVR